MRAARLHEISGVPRIDEIEAPDASNVLEVSASALNPVDISTGSGRFYGGTPDTPYVIGSEAVGTTSDGRRIWVYVGGTMGERVELQQRERDQWVNCENVSRERPSAAQAAADDG